MDILKRHNQMNKEEIEQIGYGRQNNQDEEGLIEL